jgi:hypothetical protein
MTTVNSLQTSFADPTILLNGDLTGAPTESVGIEINRGSSANKLLTWNETDDKWTVNGESFVAGTFEGNLTGNLTGDVTSTGTSTFSSIDINGGTIDGTPIGATTPAAGNFTLITGDGSAITNVFTNYNTDNLTEGTTNLFYTDERVDDRIDNLFDAAYGLSATYDDVSNEFVIQFDPINAGTGTAILDTTDTVQAKFRTIREGQVGSGGHGDLLVSLSGDEIVIDTSSKLNELANNTFTGNGSVSIYTLPYAVSQDWQVLVYIDGEVQHPVTNYAISGTTLTLTSPLGNGAKMDVLKLATNTTTSSITDATTLGGNLPNHFLSWAQTTGTPTTIAGYGITDAMTSTAITSAIATAVATKDNTDEITEGTTNLYFTNARADARITAASLSDLSNVHTTAPTDGQVLKWDNTNTRWAPETDSGHTTTDTLTEGSTNLYYTDARARNSISVSGDLTYNSSTGVIALTM